MILDPQIVCYTAVNFEHNRYQDIQLNQDHANPKADKVDSRPPSITNDVSVHLNSDVPVVYNHLLEQSDDGRAEIVEVQEVVEGWVFRGLGVFVIGRLCYETTEEKDSKFGKPVEYDVDEQELSQNRL